LPAAAPRETLPDVREFRAERDLVFATVVEPLLDPFIAGGRPWLFNRSVRSGYFCASAVLIVSIHLDSYWLAICLIAPTC